MSNSVFKHGILYAGATVFAMVTSYLFYFFVGRTLSPAEFGIFGTLMSIFYLLAIPQSTIQTVVSKTVSENKAINRDIKKDISNTFLTTFLISVLILAVLAVFRVQINNFLHFDSEYLLLFSSLTMLFILWVSITRGQLQGVQNFGSLSLNLALESAIKLVAGILFVLFGFKVFGAVAGIILGFAVAFVFSLFQAKTKISVKNIKPDIKPLINSWPILLTFVFFTLMISIDIILVKHYFDPVSAGYYNMASLFGKILFYIALSLAFVMFPKISELHMSKKEHSHVLKDSLAFLSLICFAVFIGYTFFSEQLVLIAFGASYPVVAQLITLFGLSSIMLSFSIILTFNLLAQNRKLFLAFLGSVVVFEACAIIFFHTDLITIAKILLVSNLVYLFLSIAIVFGSRIKEIKKIIQRF